MRMRRCEPGWRHRRHFHAGTVGSPVREGGALLGRQSWARRGSSGSGEAVSRRKVFKGAVGAAAVGAAGGAALAQAAASPARASGSTALSGQAGAVGQAGAARQAVLLAQATTVEPGAVAPTVVTLADAATIAVDASLGNDFRVTVAGNRTMGNPINPTAGQQVVFQVTQGAGAPFTVSWGSGYEFSAGLPQPALSAAAGQTDLLGFIYNAARGKWLLAAYVNGFG